jgi:N-acetylneuraminic acid mutarotase
VTFLFFYVSQSLAFLLLWFWPLAAASIFVVLSAYHFGETDLQEFNPHPFLKHFSIPLGYGVSATWNDELILAGGSSAEGHASQVIALRFVAGELQQRSLPPFLNVGRNHCGALIGDMLYVFGGKSHATALATSGAGC